MRFLFYGLRFQVHFLPRFRVRLYFDSGAYKGRRLPESRVTSEVLRELSHGEKREDGPKTGAGPGEPRDR